MSSKRVSPITYDSVSNEKIILMNRTILVNPIWDYLDLHG